MFLPRDALKMPNPNIGTGFPGVNAATTAPATPQVPSSAFTASPPLWNFPIFPGYGMAPGGPPSFSPYAMGPPFASPYSSPTPSWGGPTSGPYPASASAGPSTFSSPTPSGLSGSSQGGAIDLKTWCNQRNLGKEEYQALKGLEYHVGDPSSVITEEMWAWTHLGPLHKARIVAAINLGN
jgi:hypothetical protein